MKFNELIKHYINEETEYTDVYKNARVSSKTYVPSDISKHTRFGKWIGGIGWKIDGKTIINDYLFWDSEDKVFRVGDSAGSSTMAGHQAPAVKLKDGKNGFRISFLSDTESDEYKFDTTSLQTTYISLSEDKVKNIAEFIQMVNSQR